MPRTPKTRPANLAKQRPSASFSDDDMALVSEALRIARMELHTAVRTLTRTWPSSPLVERLNLYAERMEDLRERITP